MTVRESTQFSRLPQYLYLAPLFAGRRVLEVGTGTGHGAHHLAAAGAARVVGVDQSRDAVADARKRFSARNLEFQVGEYANLSFEPGSFDVVVVPRGGPLVGWLGFLEEARRILARDGVIVIGSPSARAGRGVSYEDMVARLEPLFGRVRMVAVSPFVGMSVVEYATTGAGEELEDMVLDTTLAPAAGDEVLEYVAVAGAGSGSVLPFSVYQLPSSSGVAALAEIGLPIPGTAPAPAPVVDADAQRKQAARIRELEQKLKELETKPPAPVEESGLAKKLRSREEELAQTLSENQGLKWKVSELESRKGEVAAAAEPTATPGASLEQLAQVALLHEQAMQESREAIDERDAYIEELRAELEEGQRERQRLTKQLEEAQGLAARTDSTMRDVRQKAALAEGELLKLRLAGGGGIAHVTVPSTPRPASTTRPLPNGNGTSGHVTNVAPPAVTVAPAQNAEMEAALDKATRNWKAAEAKADDLRNKINELQQQIDRMRAQVQSAPPAESSSAPGLDVARGAIRFLREEAEATVSDLRRTVEAGQRRLRMEMMEIIGTPQADSDDPLAVAHGEIEKQHNRVQELTAELERMRLGSSGNTEAVNDKLDELDELMAILAAGAREEELRLEQIERGLRDVRGRVGTTGGSNGGPRLEALQAELGQRDAELAMLHAEASRAKQRIADLVERIRGTRDRVWGRSAAEVAGLLDELLAQARVGVS